MSVAFVKNAYDKSQTTNDTTTTSTIVGVLDKFALRAFNRLAYDQEISRSLIANLLLALLKYYTIPYDVNSINIRLLYSRFYKFAINRYNQT